MLARVDSLTDRPGGVRVKVISWYDNEWGYACRLSDITAFVAGNLGASGLAAFSPCPCACLAAILAV